MLSVTCLLKIYALDLVLCCVGSSVSVFISKRSSRFDYYLSTINNISHSTLVCFILSFFFCMCCCSLKLSHLEGPGLTNDDNNDDERDGPFRIMKVSHKAVSYKNF